MSKCVYVRVVHDLELLCSSLCDPTGINKVYCYCYYTCVHVYMLQICVYCVF